MLAFLAADVVLQELDLAAATFVLEDFFAELEELEELEELDLQEDLLQEDNCSTAFDQKYSSLP